MPAIFGVQDRCGDIPQCTLAQSGDQDCCNWATSQSGEITPDTSRDFQDELERLAEVNAASFRHGLLR